MGSPRLDLIVGPNGAGKSTLARHILSQENPGSAFVNADEIAAKLWPDSAEEHSYQAARMADGLRMRLLEEGRSFTAETVFSHGSKLQLIQDARTSGFRVVLHAVAIPEDLAVERVALRVSRGGHGVPEQKIRERYRRLWDNVAMAVQLCGSAKIYDNSSSRMTQIAEFRNGISLWAPDWPEWIPAPLLDLPSPGRD